jgi:hypothetical protein
MDCPTCRVPTSDTQAFCARCGASLQPEGPAPDDSTRMAPHVPDALETGTTFAGRSARQRNNGHIVCGWAGHKGP